MNQLQHTKNSTLAHAPNNNLEEDEEEWYFDLEEQLKTNNL